MYLSLMQDTLSFATYYFMIGTRIVVPYLSIQDTVDFVLKETNPYNSSSIFFCFVTFLYTHSIVLPIEIAFV